MGGSVIDDAQERVISEFRAIDDPLGQYECLLGYAAALSPLDSDLKTDDNLVEGCQSRVWLSLDCDDGLFAMRADSDTLIIRGVLYLLGEVLSGQPCVEVARAELTFLERAELTATFDSARRKGVASVIAGIQRFAAAHAV